MLVVFFNAADIVIAKPSYSIEIKSAAVNIILAIFGIIFFTLLITIGLSLYNRFFVASHIKDLKLNKDSLRTPEDKDQAIMTFIAKNRLK